MTSRRTALALALLLSASLSACAEPKASTLDSDSVVLVDEPATIEHRRVRLAAELCSQLECDDATATRVRAILMKLPAVGRPDQVSSELTNGALADAFRQAEFDAIVLDEYWAIIRPRDEVILAALLDALVALHEALSAAQRATIGEDLRDSGLHLLETVPSLPTERVLRGGRRLGLRICTWAECSPSQQQQVYAALLDIDIQGHSRIVAEQNGRLADAFKSSTFARTTLDEYAVAMAEANGLRRQQTDEAIVNIHRALTSAQRAAVADRVEDVGVAAFGLSFDE